MKRILFRLLCLTLTLCLVWPAALAEETEEHAPVERLESSPDALFVWNDMLYAMLWNSLYRQTENGWEWVADLNTTDSANGTVLHDGSVWQLMRRSEEYDEATDSWIAPEGGLYAICRMPLQEDGTLGEAETVCAVSWDLNEEEWPQFYGFIVQDDAAYTLVFDYSTMDEWGKNALYRIDLATGKGEQITSAYMSGLTAYKDGQALTMLHNQSEIYQSDPPNTSLQPELAALDLTTGETTPLSTMPGWSCGGIVYVPETDSAYYSDQSYVYRCDCAAGTTEPVGYLNVSTSSRDSASAVVYQERYYIGDWSDETNLSSATIDPALLPTRTLRVSQSAWEVEEQIRAFGKAHPDVAVEYVETPYGAAELQQHMTSPQKADIYSFDVGRGYFTIIRDKKGFADLSGSQTLAETVGAMYPHLTGACLQDGKLFGLPVYLNVSMEGYYPETLEEVGLSEDDIPHTYAELLDFIVRWDDEFFYDWENVDIFEYVYDLRQQLFSQIFMTQILTCEAKGELMTFNTPTIRELLGRLDSQEMKRIFQELTPQQDTDGVNVIVYASDSMSYIDRRAIFSDYYDPLPSVYGRYVDNTKPLILSLDENTPPVINAGEVVLAVNSQSLNQDLAMELLEYIAQNLPVNFRTATMPDVNEPIEVANYQQNLESYDKMIAAVEKNLEEARAMEEGLSEELGGAAADIEMTLEEFRNERKRMEENRWAFSEADIANYRANIAPYLVVMSNSVFSGESSDAQKYLSMYMEGAISSEQFIQEFDRIVTWMQLEKQ